jgi:hypothetical protein
MMWYMTKMLMGPLRLPENNMHDYDPTNPVMYRVKITVKGPNRGDTHIERPMTQEELDKALGRYVRKHGPPINMSASSKGPTVLDYYSREQQGTWEVTVEFEQQKISVGRTEFVSRSTYDSYNHNKHSHVDKPIGPQPEAIQKLLDAEVITKATEWSGRNHYGY